MNFNWNQLVHEHGPAVYRIAWRILGNADDADDVTQDVFLAAHRYAQTQAVTNWIGLLKRLCVCRSVDRLRRRRPHVPLASYSIPDASPGPETLATRDELAARLRDAIQTLPAQQAEVFCLRYLEQQSNQEIAEILNLNSSAVASALHKARTRLAELLMDVMKGNSP